MTTIMQNWPVSNKPLPLLPRLHCQCKFLQPYKSLRTLIEYNDGHKRDESKVQENNTGKTKGNSEKESHQGRETRELETKVPHPLHKTITPIPVMMDQTKVEEEEEEGVTQAGGQREESLSTHKSR